MKRTTSVRLDASVQVKLEEAARLTGKLASQIIREAVEQHCDALFGQRLDHLLAGFIGVVDTGGNHNFSEDTGKAFTDLVMEKHRKNETPSPAGEST